jgi:hypothetical protein
MVRANKSFLNFKKNGKSFLKRSLKASGSFYLRALALKKIKKIIRARR